MNMPFVSIVIPTFNSASFLNRCLESLIMQSYPSNRMEIIIVDDNSTDETIKIAKSYKQVKVLANGKRNAEVGKSIGLKSSRGSLIYFGDADVIPNSSEWLHAMVKPFLENSDIFAVECNWGVNSDFSKLNTYCALLQIADPLARLIANRKSSIIKKNRNYDIYKFEKDSGPVLHSVLWKKESLLTLNNINVKFEEGSAPLELISQGKYYIAHVTNVENYHYYVNSFSDYIKKRKKIARKYLTRRREHKSTWVENTSKIKLIYLSIYLLSVIGPSFVAIYKIIKTRRFEWIWHPIISFTTICVYSYYFFIFKIQNEV